MEIYQKDLNGRGNDGVWYVKRFLKISQKKKNQRRIKKTGKKKKRHTSGRGRTIGAGAGKRKTLVLKASRDAEKTGPTVPVEREGRKKVARIVRKRAPSLGTGTIKSRWG